MAETVGSYEIILGLTFDHLLDNVLKSLVVGECEENRLDIGVVHAHMLHAVLLLVAAGKLMLLDATFHIVVDPCSHYKAISSGRRCSISPPDPAPANLLSGI